MYGLGSCINKLFKKMINPKNDKNNIKNVFKIIITYIMTTLLWVLFRADNFENALQVYKQLFTIHNGINQPYSWTFFAIILFIIAIICAIFKSKKNNEERIKGYYPVLDLNKIGNLIVFFTFIGLTVLMGYYGNTAFIYGKF